MGTSNSRLEEDKGLQLCRARKKFIKQALNGRCSVAAAHIAYIEELKILGNALRRFVEHDAQAESFAFPLRSVTPESHTFMDKSVSQLSFPSLSPSQCADTTVNMSPSPSPQVLTKHNSRHMKFSSTLSEKVEEKPPATIAVSVASTTPPHTTPRSIDTPKASFETPIPSETSPWDYFGLFHPIDNHFSSQERKGFDHGSEYSDEIQHFGEEEVSNLEDIEQKFSSPGAEESHESEDEFDQPTSATLVRSFENVNRATQNDVNGDSANIHPESGVSETRFPNFDNANKTNQFFTNEDSSIKSAESLTSVTKFVNGKKNNSPDLSPLRATSSRFLHLNDVKISPITESEVEDKVAPKDFISSLKDIEQLFVKASESGKEVPRMLEANKFHFRPVFPGKESGSIFSSLLKSCISCGDDPSEVQQEPPQNSVKYLTWHRTTSSRSASSRNLLGANSIDDNDDLSKNIFEDFCMVSGSHASTLDRLYAWEKKLYDEVTSDRVLRSNFDQKCKLLRQRESQGMNTDKTRAVVKDLHSRIQVSIHRINSISKKIEEIRDKELQPQLEELIEGLRKMWEMMRDWHSMQFLVISTSIAPGNIKITVRSDSQSQNTTIHLENELNALSSSFKKWIGAQKIYIEAIDKWLFKCVSLPQNTSKRNRRMKPPPIRKCGPPIYVICGEWLEKIDQLPSKEVVDSIKDLAAEVAHFLPHHEKNHGKAVTRSHKRTSLDVKEDDLGINTTRAEVIEDRIPAFDGFHTSLAGFLGKLNYFAECSVKMFTELQKAIQDAKNNYDQFNSQQMKVLA